MEELSFKEFVKRDQYGVPKYNNFAFFFATYEIGEKYYRSKNCFKILQQKEQELEIRLTEVVSNMRAGWTDEFLLPLENDFYKAYKIMRPYVEKDSDLFS